MSDNIASAYKRIASQVNIPGFRKGKVPSAIIDQRVGRGAVLGAMAGVINDVPERARMVGIPATPEREQMIKHLSVAETHYGPDLDRPLALILPPSDPAGSGIGAALRDARR